MIYKVFLKNYYIYTHTKAYTYTYTHSHIYILQILVNNSGKIDDRNVIKSNNFLITFSGLLETIF